MFARRENLYIGRKFITDKYFCRYFYSFVIFLERFGRRTTVLGAITWRPRRSFWHCEIYFLLIWAVSKYFLLPLLYSTFVFLFELAVFLVTWTWNFSGGLCIRFYFGTRFYFVCSFSIMCELILLYCYYKIVHGKIFFWDFLNLTRGRLRGR